MQTVLSLLQAALSGAADAEHELEIMHQNVAGDATRGKTAALERDAIKIHDRRRG